MKKVYLVYEDDYGSLMSPLFLTKVFPEDQKREAYEYTRSKGLLATVIEEDYKETLDLSAYPKSMGGMFSDE